MKKLNNVNLTFPLDDNEKILFKDYAHMHDADYNVNGALYLTNLRLVFVGLIPHNKTKVTYSVPLSRIVDVKPEKSLFILNNVLRIIDCEQQNYKFIVKGQQEWHAQIRMQLGNSEAPASV